MNLLHSAPETESVPTPLPEAAAGTTVDRFLHTVRRRQARAAVLESVLLASAAVSFGVALAGLLARAWPRGVRWVLVAAAVVAVGLVAERIWRHWTRAAGNPFRTARLVAARMPGVSLDLLAVLELRRAMAHDPSFSTELALAHLRAVDARTAQLDAQAVVDRAAVRRAGLVALGALVALALVCAAWPDRMRAALVALRPATSAGRQLAREPITSELEVLYQYPAYTGLAPRTVTSTGDLAGPKGTVVQLRTRADRMVTGAQLLLSTGATVPLRVEHGRDLSGSLVLQATGTYGLVFAGRGGREIARGPDFPLTVEPDAPPQAAVLLPGSELEVDPDQEVLLRWEASDDYGLSDVALVWTGPDGESHRQKLAHDDGRKTRGPVPLAARPAEARCRGPGRLRHRGDGQRRGGRAAEGLEPPADPGGLQRRRAPARGAPPRQRAVGAAARPPRHADGGPGPRRQEVRGQGARPEPVDA